MSKVFHYSGGPLTALWRTRAYNGRDPEGRSYFSFASFKDPDGNGWLLQEIQTRFPNREWKTRPQALDDATLAGLLRETAEHHDIFEKAHAEHRWWDWYAPYLNTRRPGGKSKGGITQHPIATWRTSFTFLPDNAV